MLLCELDAYYVLFYISFFTKEITIIHVHKGRYVKVYYRTAHGFIVYMITSFQKTALSI